jgi:hypothetical protein
VLNALFVLQIVNCSKAMLLRLLISQCGQIYVRYVDWIHLAFPTLRQYVFADHSKKTQSVLARREFSTITINSKTGFIADAFANDLKFETDSRVTLILFQTLKGIATVHGFRQAAVLTTRHQFTGVALRVRPTRHSSSGILSKLN